MTDSALHEAKTNENNVTIAKWMGEENVFIHKSLGVYKADDDHGSIDWIEGIHMLDYNSDYHLIMQVIEKIKPLVVAIEINISLGTSCRICYGSGASYKWMITESNKTITALNDIAVEFIKWHQQQSNG